MTPRRFPAPLRLASSVWQRGQASSLPLAASQRPAVAVDTYRDHLAVV